MESCSFISAIIGALVGGLFTLIGAWLTIKHENNIEHKNYIERIKPFLVIETPLHNNTHDLRKIYFKDDMIVKNEMADTTVFVYWKDFIVYNAGDNVAIIEYIRSGKEIYECFNKSPIKAGEACEIVGNPFSLFKELSLKKIIIGVSDRMNNKYEYEIKYEIGDYISSEVGGHKCKKISFSYIDCTSKMISNERNSFSTRIRKLFHDI